jgi:hypothetical protein
VQPVHGLARYSVPAETGDGPSPLRDLPGLVIAREGW